MTTYKNARNEKLAELIERREDGATLRMLETGETIEVGIPTLKRWWKLVPETTFADVEIPATDNGGSGPKYEAEPIPKKPAAPAEPTAAPIEPEATNEVDNKPEAEKSTVEPLKLSEVAKSLEELFDLLNGLYFEDKLPAPVITIQSTPKAYGHCTTKQIWKSENEAMYEINIGAEFLNRPRENTAATLLHEMVHLHCRVNDINETCQKGRYHNKTFKLEAEARDLEIGYDRAIGYSPTTPTEVFKQKLAAAGFDMNVPFARETIIAKKTSDREKPHKYTCPLCGQEVKTTADLNIVCGICEVPMSRED